MVAAVGVDHNRFFRVVNREPTEDEVSHGAVGLDGDPEGTTDTKYKRCLEASLVRVHVHSLILANLKRYGRCSCSGTRRTRGRHRSRPEAKPLWPESLYSGWLSACLTLGVEGLKRSG